MSEKLPHIYDSGREMKIRLDGSVSAKLATFRRQERPGLTDEEAAAVAIEEFLISIGMWTAEELEARRG